MSTKDYVGFTYNGVHSSEWGIVRTSDGSRFNENLLPTMQDKTVQVPGGDGAYYFGSYYTQRVFNIPFAFDSLTEEQLAKLKADLGDKGIHDLIFDEMPYKVYSAKVTGSATIKYIPFAEGKTNRVYKGEGNIQFTCFQPFARSRYKYLDAYKDEDYPNKKEWATASGLKKTEQEAEVELTGGDKSYNLYNPGDLEADFIYRIAFGGTSDTIEPASIQIGNNILGWETIYPKQGDDGIYIDSRLNLVYGFKYSSSNNNVNTGFEKTSNIYNEYFTTGCFFKIPVGESILTINGLGRWTSGMQITFDYKYF